MKKPFEIHEKEFFFFLFLTTFSPTRELDISVLKRYLLFLYILYIGDFSLMTFFHFFGAVCGRIDGIMKAQTLPGTAPKCYHYSPRRLIRDGIPGYNSKDI